MSIRGKSIERTAAVEMMEPFKLFSEYFAKKWFGRDVVVFPSLQMFCAEDEFHSAPVQVVKVLTHVVARQVAERILEVDKLVFVYRTINDYRFDHNAVGVVGFSAAHWAEAFFLFPFSLPTLAKAVAAAAVGKEIHCLNARNAVGVFGNGLNFIEVNGSEAGRKRRAPAGGFRKLLKSIGVDHCENFFFNSFAKPHEIDSRALRHAAYELHFLAKM